MKAARKKGQVKNMQIPSARSLHFLAGLAEGTGVWEGLSLETKEG